MFAPDTATGEGDALGIGQHVHLAALLADVTKKREEEEARRQEEERRRKAEQALSEVERHQLQFLREALVADWKDGQGPKPDAIDLGFQ